MKLTPLKSGASMTEFRQWAASEYNRAETLSKDEAHELRHAVKIIFDKRVPNPTCCPTCGRKEE